MRSRELAPGLLSDSDEEGRKGLKSMSMPAVLRRFALVLAVFAAGCGTGEGSGTDVDASPPAGSGVTLQFVLKSGADLGALPTQVGDVTVDSVAFWIDKLELMGDRGDGYGQEMSGRGLDLTGGPVSFDFKDASPALYSRLRVDFADSDGHGPDAFHGMELSYRVAGKTAAGPFVLSGRDEFRLDLRAVDGAELGARTKVLCVVRLDMGGWFNGVMLGEGGMGGSGGGSSGPGPGGGFGGDDGHHGDGSGDNPFLANLQRSASMTLSALPR